MNLFILAENYGHQYADTVVWPGSDGEGKEAGTCPSMFGLSEGEGRAVDRRTPTDGGHVLKCHVEQENVPFLCGLCGVRCMTKKQMDQHKKRSKHLRRMKEMGVGNDEQWVVVSPTPCQIGD